MAGEPRPAQPAPDGPAVADERRGRPVDPAGGFGQVEERDLAVGREPCGLTNPDRQSRRIGQPRLGGGTYGTIHGPSITEPGRRGRAGSGGGDRGAMRGSNGAGLINNASPL